MPRFSPRFAAVALLAASACKDSFDDRHCDRPCAELDAASAGQGGGGAGGSAGAGVAGSVGTTGGTGGTAGAAGKGGAGGASGKGGAAAGGVGGAGGAQVGGQAGSGGSPAGSGGSAGGSGAGGASGVGGAPPCTPGDTVCDGGGVRTCDASGHLGPLVSCPLGCAKSACTVPSELALGRAHSCVRLSDGAVRCWGGNDSGQVGNAMSGGNVPSVVAVAGLTDAIALASGADHTCAVRKAGSVACWGKSDVGQAGVVASSVSTPTDLPSLSSAAKIACGARHACAVDATGQVRCWGDDAAGQTGGGSSAQPVASPALVSGITVSGVIAAGDERTCAVAGADVRCWGSSGFAGGGGAVDASPTAVTGLTGATLLAAGAFHICAVTTGSVVKCLGRNDEGQLGFGSSGAATSTTDPGLVGGVTGVSQLVAGARHTCALQAGGALSCWGDASSGQVGDGTTGAGMFVASPVVLPGVVAQSVAAGDSHTCVITQAGKIVCWGANGNGQLGDGTMGDSPVPVEVKL